MECGGDNGCSGRAFHRNLRTRSSTGHILLPLPLPLHTGAYRTRTCRSCSPNLLLQRGNLRVDGVLTPWRTAPRALFDAVSSRIKLLSGMDIAERRLPQDGRQSLRVSGREIEVEGLDAIDGTPVLDIKPVMREFLPRGDIRQPDWSRELMKDYW